MDMDDDDRIVYGWDFSVTQQEQEQQDKRILGVRMKRLQATLIYVYFTIKLNHVFLNVSSNGLAELMQSHIGYICLTFLHCVLSIESSNCFPERMRCHIGCICLTFLHCVFSNVSSNRLPVGV